MMDNVSWLLRLGRSHLHKRLFGTTSLTCGNQQKASPSCVSLEEYDLDRIRNFSIVAHVDHGNVTCPQRVCPSYSFFLFIKGKSTLADRILEHSGAVDKSSENRQLLDRLEVERTRGITVKAQTASVPHRQHLLNLIDTPGHVDFSTEVSRSLLACQGVVLLVDANQGIQVKVT